MELVASNRPTAATTVVTVLTEAAVQAAITRGGKVFVQGTGTLTVATGFSMPDKNTSIEFDPRITVSIGTSAISLFTVPNGLTAVRWYEILNITAAGGNVANQWFLTYSDANSRGNVSIMCPNVSSFRNIFQHTAGDTAFNYAAITRVYGGVIVPPGVGSGYLFKTAATAGTFSFGSSSYLIGVRVYDGADITHGFTMDYDGDLYIGGEETSLSGACKVGGLSLTHSAVLIGAARNGTDSLECFGRTWDCQTFGSGFNIGLILKFSNDAGTPPIVDGLCLGYTAKIIVNCKRAQLNNITQRESNPGTPDYCIDILSTGDFCLVQGGLLASASTALIRTAAQSTRVSGVGFNSSASVNTVLEAGAADFTRVDSCTGSGTGGGLSLAVGASSRVDGVHAGKATSTDSVAHGWGRLTSKSTAVGNVGVGTDDLQTYSIPANTLNLTGRTIRVKAWGTTANNANAKTVTLAFGSQTVMTQALTTGLAGTWRIDCEIIKTGSNTQDVFAELLQLSTIIHKHTLTAGTQTDTAAITVKCTGTATADNDIVQEGMIVEVS